MDNHNYRKEFNNEICDLEMDDRVETFCGEILDTIDVLTELLTLKDFDIDELNNEIDELKDTILSLHQDINQRESEIEDLEVKIIELEEELE